MGYLIDLFKSTRPRDLLFFSGYALYLVFSYMVFHSTTVLSSASANAAQIQPLFLLASSGARVFVFLAIAFSIALSMRFLTRPSTTIASIATVAIALMSFVILGMVFQFSHYLSGSEYIPWLLLGGGLLGFADAIITLLWVRFSATLDLRTVYLFVLLSNALSLVLYFLVTLLPVSVSLPVAAALFIVAAVFAKKALDVSKPEQWEYSRPVFFGTLRTVSQPILGTAILFFLSGLMLQISGQKEIPLGEFQLISLLTSAAVVICLLLPALFIKKPLNLGRLFSVALPLSAAGFLLLPIIWNAAGGIVNSLAQLGSMVASIILWCLLVQIIQETRLHPYLLFGIAFACTDFALFAGSLIGFLNADTLQHSDIALTTVALLAAYVLFMVTLFLFKDKSFKGLIDEAEPQNSQGEALLSSRCKDVAALHQFTSREGEVFVLLAQGYTIAVISEKLFVSDNTVKSHVKSIYQKLGIHTRSELIELVNEK